MDVVRASSNLAVCSVIQHFGTPDVYLQSRGCAVYVVRGGNGLVSYVIPPATHRITGVAGVMVSIVAFQAVDPGSIPGPRNVFFFHQT